MREKQQYNNHKYPEHNQRRTLDGLCDKVVENMSQDNVQLMEEHVSSAVNIILLQILYI